MFKRLSAAPKYSSRILRGSTAGQSLIKSSSFIPGAQRFPGFQGAGASGIRAFASESKDTETSKDSSESTQTGESSASENSESSSANGAPSSSSGEPPELLECRAKLEAKDKEAAQYKDKMLRAVADFRNLQETTKREIQKTKDFALQKFAKDLLDSVDNFDRALSVVDQDKRQDPVNHKELVDLYEGIKLTQEIFEKALARHGLEKIDPIGEKFDPNLHEATFEVPQPDKEPGTVFFVQQTGFLLNKRLLRAAKVGVVKGPE